MVSGNNNNALDGTVCFFFTFALPCAHSIGQLLDRQGGFTPRLHHNTLRVYIPALPCGSPPLCTAQSGQAGKMETHLDLSKGLSCYFFFLLFFKGRINDMGLLKIERK